MGSETTVREVILISVHQGGRRRCRRGTRPNGFLGSETLVRLNKGSRAVPTLVVDIPLELRSVGKVEAFSTVPALYNGIPRPRLLIFRTQYLRKVPGKSWA